MDKEDYTPYTFTKDQIEEELLFIPEGGMPDMQVLTWDGQLLALELPQTVDLEIVETAPGIKGASASARNKPATMSTGLVILVPEYLSAGEKSVFISKNVATWAAQTNFSAATAVKRDSICCPFVLFSLAAEVKIIHQQRFQIQLILTHKMRYDVNRLRINPLFVPV